MSMRDKISKALTDANAPAIAAATQAIVRQVNRAPRSMRMEKPAIITTDFYDRLYGASVLVLGGVAQTLSIVCVYQDGQKRKCNYTFEIFQADGQTYAHRFASNKTQFSVPVAYTFEDNAYMRLTCAPELTDAEKKEAAETEKEIKPAVPAYVSCGLAFRVRRELITLDEVYEYDEEVPDA